jgi:hypothetical protein
MRTSSKLFLIAAISAALVAGCSTTPATQTGYTQACAAYGAAFEVALQARKAGKLNRAQIDQVTLVDSQVTPLCTGALPADPAAATQQITAAVTALTILEVANKAKP